MINVGLPSSLVSTIPSHFALRPCIWKTIADFMPTASLRLRSPHEWTDGKNRVNRRKTLWVFRQFRIRKRLSRRWNSDLVQPLEETAWFGGWETETRLEACGARYLTSWKSPRSWAMWPLARVRVCANFVPMPKKRKLYGGLIVLCLAINTRRRIL